MSRQHWTAKAVTWAAKAALPKCFLSGQRKRIRQTARRIDQRLQSLPWKPWQTGTYQAETLADGTLQNGNPGKRGPQGAKLLEITSEPLNMLPTLMTLSSELIHFDGAHPQSYYDVVGVMEKRIDLEIKAWDDFKSPQANTFSI